MDMGCTPQRVFTAYFADQIADLAGNRGPTHPAMSNSRSRTGEIACDAKRSRWRAGRCLVRSASRPRPGAGAPKTDGRQQSLRPFSGRPFKDSDLVAKSQVLQLQRRPCAEHRTHREKESGQQDQHRINAIFSKRRRFPIGTVDFSTFAATFVMIAAASSSATAIVPTAKAALA
jgi:hypothetical protein